MNFNVFKIKIRLGIILLFLFMAGNSYGQSGLGIGIMLGSINGLSAKAWQNNRTAIDGAISWYVWEQNMLYIHSDFLWHDVQLVKVSKGRMPLYYGIGGRLMLFGNNHMPNRLRDQHHDEKALLGLRLPAGIEYLSNNSRLEIFMELALVMDLVPGIYTGLNAEIGARIYLGRK